MHLEPMKAMKVQAGRLSTQLLFTLAVALCLVLGIVGLVLPIIPGLLFLAFAGVMLAPHVPALNRAMRRSPLLSRYMDDAENLRALNWPDQLRLGALLSLRMMLDGARFAFAAVGRLLDGFGRHHLKRAESRRGMHHGVM